MSETPITRPSPEPNQMVKDFVKGKPPAKSNSIAAKKLDSAVLLKVTETGEDTLYYTIDSLPAAFVYAQMNSGRPSIDDGREPKKTYAERLSRALAVVLANELRKKDKLFASCTPTEFGTSQEARARSSSGFKKLDVGYSTFEQGLAVGISIKTVNFRDIAKSKGRKRYARYTKNYTRIDAELRAEASDYHERQPYAVLAAILFMPVDAADDAKSADEPGGGHDHASSFGAAVKMFRKRTNRSAVTDKVDKFELFFVGLYGRDVRPLPAVPDDLETHYRETADAIAKNPGLLDVAFFDVSMDPPRASRPVPVKTLTLEQVVDRIVEVYRDRNEPKFMWDDGEYEPEAEVTLDEVALDGSEQPVDDDT